MQENQARLWDESLRGNLERWSHVILVGFFASVLTCVAPSESKSAILSSLGSSASMGLNGRYLAANQESLQGALPWIEPTHHFVTSSVTEGLEGMQAEYFASPHILHGGGASVGVGLDVASVRFRSVAYEGLISPELVWGTSVSAAYSLTDAYVPEYGLIKEYVTPSAFAPLYAHVAPGHQVIISVLGGFFIENSTLWSFERAIHLEAAGDYAIPISEVGPNFGPGFGNGGYRYSTSFQLGAYFQDPGFVGGESWVSLGQPLTDEVQLQSLPDDFWGATLRHPDPVNGDANGDLVVDLSDLNDVRNNFGGSGVPGETIGDAYPYDGVVDLKDLNAVRNNFGTLNGITAVPEPATDLTLLVVFATAILLCAVRRPTLRAVQRC